MLGVLHPAYSNEAQAAEVINSVNTNFIITVYYDWSVCGF